jgi:hypothetical protein
MIRHRKSIGMCFHAINTFIAGEVPKEPETWFKKFSPPHIVSLTALVTKGFI